MKSYTVYLFRHGLTKGNLNAQYIGHTDYPLSTFGIEQLKSIKREHPYPQVDTVFVSPLKRAMESADIMFPKNNKIVIDNLIEYNFGEFEECTAEDLKDNEDFKNWLSNIPQNIYDLMVTDNYKKVNRNVWQARHVFYVYVLLNSDKLVDYCPHRSMNIDKYNNLSHSGNCLDIRICAIDTNFNAVGVYDCNVKDTIVKNCRTWLYDAEYKGLV